MSDRKSLFSSLWENPRCRVGLAFAGLGIFFVFLGGKDLLTDPTDQAALWMIYIGFAIFLPGAVLLLITWRREITALALKTAGATIRGQVLSVNKDRLSQGCVLHYSCNDSMGRTYRGKQVLSQQEAFTWRKGEATAPATVIEVTEQDADGDKPVFVPGSEPSTFQLLGRSQPLKSASLIFVYILMTGFFLLLVAIVKETPSRDDLIGVSIYSAIVIGLFLWFVRKLWTGIEEIKDWKRIVNCGATAQGTVNIVEEKRQSLGRRTWNAGWIVSCRYSDRSGRSYSGDSGYLSRREAARWRSRDKCVIVYDPERPEKSVWIGRT